MIETLSKTNIDVNISNTPLQRNSKTLALSINNSPLVYNKIKMNSL